MSKELTLTDDNPYTALPVKQRRYVEARLQGLAQTAAAKAAGLDSKNTTKYERNPRIRAAIRYLLKESTLNVDELTKSDVLTGMMDAVNASATASELVMAWREIGKLLGVYEPEKKVLEVHDYSQQELREMKDEDLLKLAGGRMQDVIEADFEEIGFDDKPEDVYASAE